ncbi:ADH-zinc-N domain-containing protein [Mycena chlorophos]|uniref:ADH-zinc-N domain-containing protein n=1 Tax=Mycena chlorophos TaxID=658473 RepID=A0A8H6VSW6_MYCCL|nr:ADH-zinc-N domain-containing protein [Mycena chlorophos]
MSLTPNPRVLYAKVPGPGPLVAGEHLVYESTPTIDLDAPLNGGFLTKTLLLSPEPFMRERLRDPSIFTYSTPMVVGQPVVGFGLVQVLRSEKEGVKAGDYMYGFTPWEHYTVQPYVDARFDFAGANYPPYTFDMDTLVLQPVPDPQGTFRWVHFASVLGTPGLSAYVGLESVAPDMKAGQTIYVSSGASGVGSMVVQLCKNRGLRVIASASSDSKVEYIRSLGADVAFNYTTCCVAATLAEHGPLDYYWDNVCGKQLEAAIQNMALNGLIITCGAMSEYNLAPEECYGVKNLSLIFKRRLRIQGFIMSDALPELLPRFMAEVPALLAQGKIKSQEQLYVGLDKGIEAFLSLYDGSSKAKPVVVVDEAYACM